MIEDLIILYKIGSIISVFIEPATWALVENDSYSKNNINNYFTNETMKNYAQQVYEDSKKLGNYEEVVNRVKRVLQIDLTQYLNTDLNDILEDMYKKFTKDYSNSDVSFSNTSLILVLNRSNQ